LEFILMHRPLGPLPPETLAAALQNVKKIIEDPSKVVPGGKLIAAYNALGQWLQVCIWDAPSVEALLPLMGGMTGSGFNTEVIPAEKVEAAIPKWEKSLAEKRA